MKVVDVMMGTPYYCRPDTNLGSATELMWTGNCGFLPVVGSDERVVGIITDRDICVALGTRGRPSGEVTVSEVMSQKVYACAPEDEIHLALRAMRDGHVRRLPVITKAGALVGVISMDDVLLRAEAPSLGKASELSSEEIVKTFRAINTRQLPQAVATKSAVA
ncbi:MAG TPA: CBS domain-containing protein [Candidatus Solibacter sp.]|nr:CBS domain-containing protein [Candidatus Solibacter sp.]